MNLKNLRQLSLSDGQIIVYSALLEEGISPINKIQEKTGIERRNIYDILNKLIDRGLVTAITENKRKTYRCTHPNKLKEDIQTKEEQLAELKNQLPDVLSVYNQSKLPITAEIYRGNEAIKALLDEALDYDTYWIGGNAGVERTPLKLWFKNWMRRRVEKKKMMYDLVDYGSFLEGLPPEKSHLYKKNYFQLKELPKELASPMVILIFGNKVAQILWSDQSFAFVLESKEIRNSFLKYFKYFWKKHSLYT